MNPRFTKVPCLEQILPPFGLVVVAGARPHQAATFANAIALDMLDTSIDRKGDGCIRVTSIHIEGSGHFTVCPNLADQGPNHHCVNSEPTRARVMDALQSYEREAHMNVLIVYGLEHLAENTGDLFTEARARKEVTEALKAWAIKTGILIVAAVDSDLLGTSSPIARMVDEASGRNAEIFAAFCDWVTTALWGIEGQEEEEDE